MRASRLLSILLLLQTRGRMTAQALADEFEVSVRTIYRDIDQLSAADVPVYADRGANGGFQLLDGYRTRLTGLTPAEAEALFLAGLPGPAAELGLGDAMAQGQLKLLAALPDPMRADAQRPGKHFHLDPIGWFKGAEQVKLLPLIAPAVFGEKRLAIRYDSWKGVVERQLDPLGLVLKAGVWYLIGQVGQQVRTYRAASILDVQVLEEGFIRPPGFDLSTFWENWAQEYEQRMQQRQSSVRLSPRGMTILAREGQVIAQALRTAGPADDSGWREVTLPIESIEVATASFLALGIEVEVLAPPDLRDSIRQTAASVAARYS
ncbi:helix-turn-helix transcriptional regulator [Lacibacterium aquatile]|uniref:Helix-turn-helix transcriptional regulator n=1 Tax=Lacibacterium aquatile TaxID=1168082 RepID=A0ABW5DVK2_9PROT